MRCSITRLVTVLALLYLIYNIYIVYTIFSPASCDPKQKKDCLVPAYTRDRVLQV